MSLLARFADPKDNTERSAVVMYACMVSALAFLLSQWILLWQQHHAAGLNDLLATASVTNFYPAALLLIAALMNVHNGNNSAESRLLNKIFAIAAVVLIASCAYGLGYVIVTARSVLLHHPRYFLTGSFTTILVSLIFSATAFRTTLAAASSNEPHADGDPIEKNEQGEKNEQTPD